MAGDMPEVGETQESVEQLETHPRALDAAAATAGDRSQPLGAQQGSAGVQVAAAAEPGRCRIPNFLDGIRALKVLDEYARQVSWGLHACRGWAPWGCVPLVMSWVDSLSCLAKLHIRAICTCT